MPNFTGAGQADAAGYDADRLDRLRAIKRDRDPDGVIRSNKPVLGGVSAGAGPAGNAPRGVLLGHRDGTGAAATARYPQPARPPRADPGISRPTDPGIPRRADPVRARSGKSWGIGHRASSGSQVGRKRAGV